MMARAKAAIGDAVPALLELAKRTGIDRRDLVLWTLFIALSTAMQLSFKIAGDALEGIELGPRFVNVALSHPSVWISIAGYIAVFVVWIQILETAPLSRAFLMTALVYIPVTIGAWALFGERIGLLRVLGIGLIVVGVALLGVERRVGQQRTEEPTDVEPSPGASKHD